MIIGTASKSKAVEGLAGRQAGIGEMALDAAPVTLGELVLGQRGEEAGGWPALLVGRCRRSPLPDGLDGRQPQLGEHEGEAAGVDGGGACVFMRLA